MDLVLRTLAVKKPVKETLELAHGEELATTQYRAAGTVTTAARSPGKNPTKEILKAKE